MNKLLLSLICVTSLASSIPSFASAPKPSGSVSTPQECVNNFNSTPSAVMLDSQRIWKVSFSNSCTGGIILQNSIVCSQNFDDAAENTNAFKSKKIAGKSFTSFYCSTGTSIYKPVFGNQFKISWQ